MTPCSAGGSSRWSGKERTFPASRAASSRARRAVNSSRGSNRGGIPSSKVATSSVENSRKGKGSSSTRPSNSSNTILVSSSSGLKVSSRKGKGSSRPSNSSNTNNSSRTDEIEGGDFSFFFPSFTVTNHNFFKLKA